RSSTEVLLVIVRRLVGKTERLRSPVVTGRRASPELLIMRVTLPASPLPTAFSCWMKLSLPAEFVKRALAAKYLRSVPRVTSQEGLGRCCGEARLKLASVEGSVGLKPAVAAGIEYGVSSL